MENENNIQKGKRNLGILNRIILALNIIGLAGGGLCLGFGIPKIVENDLGWGISLTVLGSMIILIALSGLLLNVYMWIMKRSVVAVSGSIKQVNDAFGTVGMKKCKNCGTEIVEGQKTCKTCETEIENI